MPHKVNPIDFENAEGNFGLANALLAHLSAEAADQPLAARPDRQHRAAQHGRGARLHAARLRLRCSAGWTSSRSTDAALAADLDAAWEVLAEPVQTVMRRYGLPNPYERLKELTRGKAITREAMRQFIDSLRAARGREDSACWR